DIADGFEQPPIVEPFNPFQRRKFNRFEGSPGSSPMDHLGLVEAVDRLGQGIVITVADAADRWLDPGFRQALGVANGDVLRPAVAMMNEPAAMDRASLMDGLFQ